MVKNYSKRARGVLSLARLRAEQEGSRMIRPSHVLAAMVIEDQGPDLAMKLLSGQVSGDASTWLETIIPRPEVPFFTFDQARTLLARLGSGKQPAKAIPSPGSVSLAPDTEKILNNAMRFKINLHQKMLKPAHIFAGAVVSCEFVATMFRELGLDENAVLGATLYAPLQH